MKRARIISTFPGAEAWGEEAFRKGGSALKAALTAFFVAAGERPGILFSQVSLIVAGLGVGVRVYDGRARQPGLDAKRPRGFIPGESIPIAAQVAVPSSIAALAVACAYDAGTTFLSCARPGVPAARRVGAEGRADLLELVATQGATVFNHPSLKRAWIGQFGPAEGGNIGPADLVVPSSLDAQISLTDATIGLPWGEVEEERGLDKPWGTPHAIVAIDGQGQLVALAFHEQDDVVQFAPYEVTVPLLAEPVMRGVARRSPGQVIPSPVDLRVSRNEEGAWSSVSAWSSKSAEVPRLRLVRDPQSKQVSSVDLPHFELSEPT